MQVIPQFEARHPNPESGALLLFAVWAVDSLYYLHDVDCALDPSQAMIGEHVADVVDVAHARWAVGTCITSLDLCAAALGRALCAHTGPHELAIGSFDRKNKRATALRAKLPSPALQWIDNVLTDLGYHQIKEARDSLIHARLRRHFSIPRKRLSLKVGDNRVDVPTIVDRAKDVGTRHVLQLLAILPEL